LSIEYDNETPDTEPFILKATELFASRAVKVKGPATGTGGTNGGGVGAGRNMILGIMDYFLKVC
jgi:hypothetical protein